MQTAYNQFLANIGEVKKLEDLFHFLKYTQGLPNDLSDLLRAEIIYSISALDKLVHELVRIGMVQAFKGNRSKTPSFDNFTISAQTLDKIMETSLERSQNPTRPILASSELPEYWFEQEIMHKHKFLAFQDTKKMSEGLSLIWNENHKWQKIATLMGKSESEVKTPLEMMVTRRNQIAHEADIHLLTQVRNTIMENDVNEFVIFVESLGKAIFDCVK